MSERTIFTLRIADAFDELRHNVRDRLGGRS
jgi:hypothetical protein